MGLYLLPQEHGKHEDHSLSDKLRFEYRFYSQRPWLVKRTSARKLAEPPHPVHAVFHHLLQHLLPAADVVLSTELLDDLNAAHKAHPMPY